MTKPRWRYDWSCDWWYRITPDTFEVWMKPWWNVRAYRSKGNEVS